MAPPRSADRTKGVGGPTLDPAVRRRNEVALDLVIDAVTTALTSVDVLERHARDVAAGFRQSDVRPARQGLTELVQTTQTMLRLAMVATPSDEWSPEAAARSHARLDLRKGFDSVLASRQREADEFFASVTPSGATPDEAMVLRQAVAGLMWGKQFYHWDVARWLAGDEPGALAAYATLARAGNRELATRAVEKARSLYRSRTGTMGRLLLTLGPLFAASLRSGRLRLPPPRSGADGGTPAAPR